MHSSFLKIGIAAVLVLMLVCCGAAAAHEDHDDITWSESSSLPSTAGSYYLTSDITLSATWSVPTGTTNLCLNGHVINANGGSFSVITVGYGATLNLYDCNTTAEYYFEFDDDGPWTLYTGSVVPTPSVDLANFNRKTAEEASSPYYVKVTGGVITGGNAEKGGGVCNNAEFTMTDGNIVGNSAEYGGGVCSNAEFTMTGGNIVGNSAEYDGGDDGGSGGGVCSYGTFTMTGGEITGNSANDGGGVYFDYGAFYVSGTPEISGNTKTDDGANNVYLLDNKYINIIDDGLTGDAKIGVTTETEPTSDTPVNVTGTNTADNSSFFESDNSSYRIKNAESNNVVQLVCVYTVTYEGNGHTSGAVPVDEHSPYFLNGEVAVLGKGTLEKKGYSFNNWTNQTGFGYSEGNTFTITEDTILKANWTAHTYNVTFNNNTGTGTMENQTFVYDEAQNLKANTFTKSGHTFAGWATTPDGTVVYADKQRVNNLIADDKGTVTLYAVWTPNSQPSHSSSRNYGASVWLTATPTPTPVPTVEPTQAQPTAAPIKPQSTSTSPAPLAAVLAGLGAAGVLFGVRRK